MGRLGVYQAGTHTAQTDTTQICVPNHADIHSHATKVYELAKNKQPAYLRAHV